MAGPTATGKSGLAIELALAARELGRPAEIISADSRQVYRGMDIGTAKTPSVEREGVPHHGLDVVDPDEAFSVADFARHASQVLGDKDAAAMIGFLAGACRAIVTTRSRHPRASSPAGLASLAERAGCRAEAVESPREAVQRARALAGRRGAVLVCGSLYLLGDLRPWLLRPPPTAVGGRPAVAGAPDKLAPGAGPAR